MAGKIEHGNGMPRIIFHAMAAVFLIQCCGAIASTLDIYPETSVVSVSMEAIDATSLRMNLDCSDMPLQFAQQGNQSRVWLEFEHEGFTDEPGKASLPLITRYIAIPPNAQLRVDILNSDSRVVNNVQIVPVAPDGDDAFSRAWVDDPQWLSSDAPYPQESVTIGQGMRLRNLWLVPVTIAPARYYPRDQRLETVQHLEIQLTVEGGTFRDASMIQGRLVESYDQMYKALVANYNLLELDQQPIRGTYLIICPNNQTVIDILQDLVQWKNRMGYRALLVNTSQTGTTYTTVRNYIRTAYTTWEYPPEFVCLVGDASGMISIPTHGNEYDHYYTEMDNDVFPDLAVGRLSCDNTTTLQTIINKIMHYEKEPYMSQTAWYRKGMMIAGESESGISTIHTKRSIRWRLLQHGYAQVDTMWYTMGGSIVTAISNAFNGGIGMFNYRGFIGMSNWTNNNTNNLSNGYMLPVVITLTCGTGNFNTQTSVSEGFLRAGSPTSPKGGIASIGTATSSTHTKYNNCMDIGIFAGMFDANLPHMGEALNFGKVEMRRNYPNGAGDSFIYWNNLMGDPGLVVWKQLPLPMTVTYEDTIGLGINAFTIHVTDQSLQPVEDAYACLWQESGTLYQVGYTDQDGNVELNCNGAQLGSFLVTVTKPGYIPHLGQTTVVTVAQSLALSSAPLDDDNTGMSQGNGDGNWNPNERVEIQPTIINRGTQQIQNIQAVLESDDELLTIIQGTGSFGNISSGSSSQMTSSFVVSLNPGAPNGHLCRLKMALQGTGFSQMLYLDYEAVSYEINFRELTVSGGSNSVLEPGETANIIIQVQNGGDFAGNSITAVLRGDPNYLEIVDSVAIYGNIAIGASAQNTSDPFTVHAFAGVIPGIKANLTMITTSLEGIIDTLTTSVQIQQANSLGSPLGPDLYGYFCFDNTDTGYAQAPDYEWIEIDPHYGGAGTQILLTDYGDEQDDSKLVMLPFPFRYYGVNYDRIAVCSNGWLAMGDQTYFEDFRNWSIPSPQGPPAMIAPFWDDLIVTSGTGTGKVYYWYDSANNLFVVEWSRVPNRGYGTPQETFEVILYNPDAYPTPSGDGDILFQYNHIVNVTGAGSDNDYATVGIEDYSQTDGIEYTWMNAYPAQAAALTDGRAIRFTAAPGLAPEPPSMALDSTEFHFSLVQGTQEDDTLWVRNIGNIGASPLIFSVQTIEQQGRPFAPYPIQADWPYANYSNPIITTKSSVENKSSRGILGLPPVDSNGGPDAYGYIWIDSDDLGGPEYQWIDISAIGTEVQWVGDPDESSFGPVDIGFNFPFYGTLLNTLQICSNGYLSFTDTTVQYANRELPTVNAPANLLAIWWDDLDPEFGGAFYYWSNQIDTFIVTVDSVMGWGDPNPRGGPYYFQAILTRNGKIKYQYQNMGTIRLDESTIGIQDGTRTMGLTVVHNAQYIANEKAVEFTAPMNWLQVDPGQGTVDAGDSMGCQVSAITNLLEPGEYGGTLRVQSNDPLHPTTDIGVSLLVTPNGQNPPTVFNIPSQSINEGETFQTITLDNYVTDPVYSPQEMIWTTFGASQLTVIITDRVATIIIPNEDWFGQETITFRATNPLNLWDSDPATFTVMSVNDPPVIDPELPDITFRNDSLATLDLTEYGQDIEDPDSLLNWSYSGNVSVHIAIDENQVATFTSNPGFVGEEQIIFTLHDTDDSTAIDTILVTVQPALAVPGIGESGIPREYFLAQNYPNPFNPQTMIRFGLPEPAQVRLIIYNILGQIVVTPIDGVLEAGYHQVTFETANLSSGVYFYSINTPKFHEIRKMVLMR